MSFSQIDNLIGKYNPYLIRDIIMQSNLSEYEKAKLIGKLVAASFSGKPSGFKSRI